MRSQSEFKPKPKPLEFTQDEWGETLHVSKKPLDTKSIINSIETSPFFEKGFMGPNIFIRSYDKLGFGCYTLYIRYVERFVEPLSDSALFALFRALDNTHHALKNTIYSSTIGLLFKVEKGKIWQYGVRGKSDEHKVVDSYDNLDEFLERVPRFYREKDSFLREELEIHKQKLRKLGHFFPNSTIQWLNESIWDLDLRISREKDAKQIQAIENSPLFVPDAKSTKLKTFIRKGKKEGYVLCQRYTEEFNAPLPENIIQKLMQSCSNVQKDPSGRDWILVWNLDLPFTIRDGMIWQYYNEEACGLGKVVEHYNNLEEFLNCTKEGYDLSLMSTHNVSQIDVTILENARQKGMPILIHQMEHKDFLFGRWDSPCKYFVYGKSEAGGWHITEIRRSDTCNLRDLFQNLSFKKRILEPSDERFTESLINTLKECHVPPKHHESFREKIQCEKFSVSRCEKFTFPLSTLHCLDLVEVKPDFIEEMNAKLIKEIQNAPELLKEDVADVKGNVVDAEPIKLPIFIRESKEKEVGCYTLCIRAIEIYSESLDKSVIQKLLEKFPNEIERDARPNDNVLITTTNLLFNVTRGKIYLYPSNATDYKSYYPIASYDSFRNFINSKSTFAFALGSVNENGGADLHSTHKLQLIGVDCKNLVVNKYLLVEVRADPFKYNDVYNKFVTFKSKEAQARKTRSEPCLKVNMPNLRYSIRRGKY